MAEYTRKELAEKLGVGMETLRYYERVGVIKAPKRDGNGYRRYSEECATELSHILTAKKYGFTLMEMRKLVEAAKRKDFSKEEIKALAIEKLADIDRQIAELMEYKRLLVSFTNNTSDQRDTGSEKT